MASLLKCFIKLGLCKIAILKNYADSSILIIAMILGSDIMVSRATDVYVLSDL